MAVFVACFLITILLIFLCLISDDFAWFLFILLACVAIAANMMCIYCAIFGGA